MTASLLDDCVAWVTMSPRRPDLAQWAIILTATVLSDKNGPVLVVAAVVYRPGSQRLSKQFFCELSALLESLATYNFPLLIVGDMKVNLKRPSDPDRNRPTQLIQCSELIQCVSEPTHRLGGLLDVVITAMDRAPNNVKVADVGLSDHQLIPSHPLVTVDCRPQHHIHEDAQEVLEEIPA